MLHGDDDESEACELSADGAVAESGPSEPVAEYDDGELRMRVSATAAIAAAAIAAAAAPLIVFSGFSFLLAGGVAAGSRLAEHLIGPTVRERRVAERGQLCKECCPGQIARHGDPRQVHHLRVSFGCRKPRSGHPVHATERLFAVGRLEILAQLTRVVDGHQHRVESQNRFSIALQV